MLLAGRATLLAESLALRQQLTVLQRNAGRPRLRRRDRIFWVWLSGLWTGWRSALVIVQRNTVVRWHRQGFRFYWRFKSRRRRDGRPAVSRDVRDLIRRIAIDCTALRCGCPRLCLSARGFYLPFSTSFQLLSRIACPPGGVKTVAHELLPMVMAFSWTIGHNHRMKRIAKLAWFTLLGALVALPIYSLLLLTLSSIRSGFGGAAESYMLASFAVVMPIAFFLGSCLTGYLSQPLLRTWPLYIGVSPGLYPCLIMIAVNVVMIYVVKDSDPPPFPENLYLLGVFVSWFLSSWAGVWAGAHVRSGKERESN